MCRQFGGTGIVRSGWSNVSLNDKDLRLLKRIPIVDDYSEVVVGVHVASVRKLVGLISNALSS